VNKILLTLVEGTVNQRLGKEKSDMMWVCRHPSFFVTNFLTINSLSYLPDIL
jgi:hypothetical protein